MMFKYCPVSECGTSTTNHHEIQCRMQIKRWLRRYISSSEDIEDLCQEVCCRCWRHASSFKGRSRHRTWLYRVVVNVCLDFKRRRSQHPEMLMTDLDEGVWISAEARLAAETYEQSLARFFLALEVQALLSHLTPSQRQILELKYILGYSTRDISNQLGLKEASVETALYRTREALKKIWSQWNG